MVVLGAFASVSLAVTALAIYALIAFSVGCRTREIGFRMALGAPPARLPGLFVVEGLRPAAAGAAAGLSVSFYLVRLIAGLLYGVDARDVTTFAAIPLVLLAAAALASYLPARRAARVDPLVALRNE